MSKKENIIKDLDVGMRKIDIANKYNVKPPYISRIIKERKTEKIIETITQLIQKGAITFYKSKMTEEELKTLEEL